MEKEAETLDNTTAQEPAPAARKRLPMGITILAFAVLIGFVALLGWGLSRSMQGSIQIGDKVPQFSYTTFDGKVINSGDFAGKVVVLNFWASWCKPCEQEARELEEVYQYYKEGNQVEFVGLAYVDTEPESLKYLQKFGVTYPNGPDLATKISQMFRVKGVPETFIIDKHGKLAYFKAGPFTSLEEITSLVDSIAQR